MRTTLVAGLTACPLAGALLGVASAAVFTEQDNAKALCIDTQIPAPLRDAAISVGQANAIGWVVRDCTTATPIVVRVGYRPRQPELSVDPAAIRRDTGQPVQVIVRPLPASPGTSALAALTGYIVASGFACAGESCEPREWEVYVGPGDSQEEVRRRVERAFGLAE